MSSAVASNLTLYTAKVCPYAARAELALALAGIDYQTYEVDLLNKPPWYAERINKASKVPVLVSEEPGNAFKLPESLVIVEYVQDLTSAIFPPGFTPQQKAASRYLVERYSQLVQPHYVSTALKRDASALPALRAALVEFNTLLRDFDTEGKQGPFVLGEHTFGYADLNIAPFVARILAASKHDLLPKSESADRKIDQELEEGAQGLERLKTWWDAVQAVEAWQHVWVEEKYTAVLKKRLAELQ